VLEWFAKNGRDFPWRKANNPYYVLIAEILLRRTQANRVVEPYLGIIKRFPTPEDLSHADVSELRQWFQPLGLIKRADWLIDTAKQIVSEHAGIVPSSLDVLSKLTGMGVYSSRAVLCLAYGKAVPMIDESSGRLLRRILNQSSNCPAYSDRRLLKIAEDILPTEHARDFNLGLLDIAYSYCHYKLPDCPNCPLVEICSFSRNQNIFK
jgi:A/G-specific adenine glycosylase